MERICERFIMTDLPDTIEQATCYQDVNLKRVIAWLLILWPSLSSPSLAASRPWALAFSFLLAYGLLYFLFNDFQYLQFILQPFACG